MVTFLPVLSSSQMPLPVVLDQCLLPLLAVLPSGKPGVSAAVTSLCEQMLGADACARHVLPPLLQVALPVRSGNTKVHSTHSMRSVGASGLESSAAGQAAALQVLERLVPVLPRTALPVLLLHGPGGVNPSAPKPDAANVSGAAAAAVAARAGDAPSGSLSGSFPSTPASSFSGPALTLLDAAAVAQECSVMDVLLRPSGYSLVPPSLGPVARVGDAGWV